MSISVLVGECLIFAVKFVETISICSVVLTKLTVEAVKLLKDLSTFLF